MNSLKQLDDAYVAKEIVANVILKPVVVNCL